MKQPQDHLTINIGEEETQVELFMSFALLNQLTAALQNSDDLQLLHDSPETRMFVTEQLLGSLKRKKKAPINSGDITLNQGDKIIDWVQSHLEFFFLSRMKKKIQTQQNINKTLQNT